jgi:uncharacterized membrane protein (UPF0127 family)
MRTVVSGPAWPHAAGRVRRARPAAALMVLLLCCLPVLSACSSRLPKVRLVIGGQSFSIEVARTEEQKRRGLMNRKSLGRREGMIFLYGSDQHLSFWMKNTPLPLTLAFLSKEGEILQIEQLKPFSLKAVMSERAARYALELPQGVLAELGVGVGDRVELPAGLD